MFLLLWVFSSDDEHGSGLRNWIITGETFTRIQPLYGCVRLDWTRVDVLCFALHSDTRIAVVPVTCPHSLHDLRPSYVTGALSGTTALHHRG